MSCSNDSSVISFTNVPERNAIRIGDLLRSTTNPLPAQPCNDVSPKRRSRKHEIDFLVLEESAEPTRKKIKFEIMERFPILASENMKQHSKSQQVLPIPKPEYRRIDMTHHFSPVSFDSVTTIQCSECSFSSLHAAEALVHSRFAHPNKPYACGVCGRCFSEKGNMNKHYRTVHLRERKHRCKECGRCFGFLDGLNRHISMVHLDRRPFQCNVCHCPVIHGPSDRCVFACGMKFKQKSHYRRHVRSVHQLEVVDK